MASGIMLALAGCHWMYVTFMAAGGVIAVGLRRQLPALALIGIALGWIAAVLATPTPAPQRIFDGNPRFFYGRTLSAVDHADLTSAIIQVDSIGNGRRSTSVEPFRMQLYFRRDRIDLPAGSTIRVEAIPERSGGTLSLPYTPDFSMSLLADGIVAEAFAVADSINITGTRHSLSTYMAARRAALIRTLDHPEISNDTYGILTALFAADRSRLSADITSDFRDAGIAHTLALSGFHLSFIIALASLLLYPLRIVPRLRRLRLALTVCAAWLFVIFTGCGDSLVRAAIMFSIFMLGRIVGRQSSALNSLCLAAVLILAISPFSLYSVGFQLSFAAVAGILTFGRLLNPVNPRRRLHFRVMQLFCATLGAIAGTALITIFYFHSFPLNFIPANVALVFALPILMISGITIVIFGAWDIYFTLPAAIADAATGFLAATARTFATPAASLFLSRTALTALLFLTAIAAIALMRRSRRSVIIFILALPVCSAVALLSADDIPAVEAFLLSSRGGTTIVVRSGPEARAIHLCDSTRLVQSRMRLAAAGSSYMASRSIDTIPDASPGLRLPPFSRSSGLLAMGSRIWAIPCGEPDSTDAQVGAAIVTRLYKGDIASLVRRLHPDTVYIGRDVNLRRARLLAAEADSLGVVTVDLRGQKNTLRIY